MPSLQLVDRTVSLKEQSVQDAENTAAWVSARKVRERALAKFLIREGARARLADEKAQVFVAGFKARATATCPPSVLARVLFRSNQNSLNLDRGSHLVWTYLLTPEIHLPRVYNPHTFPTKHRSCAPSPARSHKRRIWPSLFRPIQPLPLQVLCGRYILPRIMANMISGGAMAPREEVLVYTVAIRIVGNLIPAV